MNSETSTPQKVGIFGGTGYVGSYLVDRLLDQDKHPVLLVRPGSESKVRQADRCTLITGDMNDQQAIDSVAEASDALIFNIGILREFPDKGITFEELQFNAARRAVDAATNQGVTRFLLMSANGVKEEGTSYQNTKFRAETYLKSTQLDWTIFRPSVLFGDPRGRMEFATQLTTDIIDSALPAPLFYPGLLPFKAGQFAMSPVHVNDVAKAFVYCLEHPESIGQTYHLGGPEALSWKAILKQLAAVRGKKKLMVPAPALGVSAAAALLERFEDFPITRDQITMLLQGNTCAPDDLRQLGIEPQAFSNEALAYLNELQD